jgi:hypothetical protein
MSIILIKKSSELLKKMQNKCSDKKRRFFFICHCEGFGDNMLPMDNVVRFYESR